MARPPPIAPSSAGMTGPDVAELNADLVALGYATPSSDSSRAGVLRVGHHRGRGEAPGRPRGDPERHPGARPGGVRADRGSGDGAVRPSSGAAPSRARRCCRRTSTTRQVSRRPGRLPAVRRGGRGQGHHHPAQQPDHPGRRLLGGHGRHLPVELAARPARPPAAVSVRARHRGRHRTPTITVDVTPTDPAATGTWDQAPVKVDDHHRPASRTRWSCRSTPCWPRPAAATRSRSSAPAATDHLVPVSPRALRRRRRAGAGDRLGAGRRPAGGGPDRMTTLAIAPASHRRSSARGDASADGGDAGRCSNSTR